MTDTEKAIKLWRELRHDDSVSMVQVGKVVISKAKEDRSDDYDLRNIR